MSKKFRWIFCYANLSEDWTQLYAVIFMGYFVSEMFMSAMLCDSQDWNLLVWNKVRQCRKTPSEVHALLKLQNPVTLLVELTGVWPGCPAAGAAAALHIPVCRACGTDTALLLQGWHGWRCLVFLCFPWPCHHHHNCADSSHFYPRFGAFIIQKPALEQGSCSWRFCGSWVPQIASTTNQGESMAGWEWGAVLLPAGVTSSLCRARKRREDSNVYVSFE